MSSPVPRATTPTCLDDTASLEIEEQRLLAKELDIVSVRRIEEKHGTELKKTRDKGQGNAKKVKQSNGERESVRLSANIGDIDE